MQTVHTPVSLQRYLDFHTAFRVTPLLVYRLANSQAKEREFSSYVLARNFRIGRRIAYLQRGFDIVQCAVVNLELSDNHIKSRQSSAIDSLQFSTVNSSPYTPTAPQKALPSFP